MNELVEEDRWGEVATRGETIDGGGMIVLGKPTEVTKVEVVSISIGSSMTIGESLCYDKVSSDEWGVSSEATCGDKGCSSSMEKTWLMDGGSISRSMKVDVRLALWSLWGERKVRMVTGWMMDVIVGGAVYIGVIWCTWRVCWTKEPTSDKVAWAELTHSLSFFSRGWRSSDIYLECFWKDEGTSLIGFISSKLYRIFPFRCHEMTNGQVIT